MVGDQLYETVKEEFNTNKVYSTKIRRQTLMKASFFLLIHCSIQLSRAAITDLFEESASKVFFYFT